MSKKLVETIKAKYAHLKDRLFRLQFDNAKPHVSKNSKSYLARLKNSAAKDGWKIEFNFQPPCSPDCNILDLAGFKMIASKVKKFGPYRDIKALMKKIKHVWENEVSVEVLSRAFVTLQALLREIILHLGDNNFHIPHLKTRIRHKLAMDAGMDIPMVRFAITEEEYDRGWSVWEEWWNREDNENENKEFNVLPSDISDDNIELSSSSGSEYSEYDDVDMDDVGSPNESNMDSESEEEEEEGEGEEEEDEESSEEESSEEEEEENNDANADDESEDWETSSSESDDEYDSQDDESFRQRLGYTRSGKDFWQRNAENFK